MFKVNSFAGLNETFSNLATQTRSDSATGAGSRPQAASSASPKLNRPEEQAFRNMASYRWLFGLENRTKLGQIEPNLLSLSHRQSPRGKIRLERARMSMADRVLRDSHPITQKVQTQLKEIKKQLPLKVLSLADWEHWVTKGYVIVRNAVPSENIHRLVRLLWEFDEKNPNDPSTWYAPQRRENPVKELNETGLLEIYNHQYLWDNRQVQRVYDAFVDIWDMEELWVSIDRANLNPPKRTLGNVDGFIHWDVDTSLDPKPIGVQGVLSLVDQDGDIGGFQCIPELFYDFDNWVETQPADRDSKHPDYSGYEVTKIKMNAGDLLIWNSLLAHGVGPNYSKDWVRMAQYISMFPANEDNLTERTERIRFWRELDHPERASYPGDPREWEKKHAKSAVLNLLGQKLLGLETWS